MPQNSNIGVAKHTPGPWFVDPIERGTIGSIETKDGDCIAQAMQMVPVQKDLYQEHRKANARLIAAAPELLEEHRSDDVLLMQMAVVFYREDVKDYIPFGLLDKVRDRVRRGTPAIAKAEGR